jgi:tRNA nucleotidyltransferase (CCA-adding enzyme)
MTNITEIISHAIKQFQPGAEDIEELTNIATEIKGLVSHYLSPKITNVVFGGSFAKGTWLKDDVDIDIFIKIDRRVPDREFEILGKQIGLQSLKGCKPYLRYSDHPYVEAIMNGYRINIVPCYDVTKGKWLSAADRSPFHTDYVKKNLNNDQRNHVRLLKKFLKSSGVYGADIATGGFSGYVAEIMILKYGTFGSVLQAISTIRAENTLISLGKPAEFNQPDFQSQLIIIDPIDHRRNLGTAISPESVGKFILAARKFLAEPSFDFFIKKRKKISRDYGSLYPNLLIVEFRYKMRSPDVIWGQLKRSLNAISRQLDLANFKVIRSISTTDEKKKAVLAFLLESPTVPSYTQKNGPKIFMRRETDHFISRNYDKSLILWIDSEMRVKGLVKRKITNAKHYLKLLLTERIEFTGITKGLVGDIQKSFRIYTGNNEQLKGIAKNAVKDLVSSDQHIF